MPLKKAIRDVPLEIWLKIFKHLPQISPRKLSVAFGKSLVSSDRELCHRKVWDIIFDNYKFLDSMNERGYPCILLGNDLETVYHSSNLESLRGRTYGTYVVNLVLLYGTPQGAGELGGRHLVEEFARSAKEDIRRQIPKRNEYSTNNISFFSSLKLPRSTAKLHVTLNISNLYSWGYHPIVLPAPYLRTLVSFKDCKLYSAYLYWKHDRNTLRIIGPVSGGTLNSVKAKCRLTIELPRDKREWASHERFPWTVLFEASDGLY